jgi:SAM-dependent methyltransferase
MPGLISKLVKWVISPPSGGSGIPVKTPSRADSLIEKLKNAPDDLNWMCPPNTVSNPAPWDKYWTDQVEYGVAGFTHMFVQDGQLVDAMVSNGLGTVLCVGNGVSHEARALSEAGFAVTALDLSPLANRVSSASVPEPVVIQRLLEGRPLRAGGRLEFVTGDVRDVSVCPGPFDVVIERRTLQLFPDDELPAVMQAVAGRLAPRGVFFSHCHDGRWKPPATPRNRPGDWFVDKGWTRWHGETPLTGRVAWTLTTTG